MGKLEGPKQRRYHDNHSSCFDWPYSLLSLYFLALPLLSFGTIIQNLTSLEENFIKTYNIFSSVLLKISRLLKGVLVHLPDIMFLELFQQFF